MDWIMYTQCNPTQGADSGGMKGGSGQGCARLLEKELVALYSPTPMDSDMLHSA